MPRNSKTFPVSSMWIQHAHGEGTCELCMELRSMCDDGPITYVPLHRRDLLVELWSAAADDPDVSTRWLQDYAPLLVKRIMNALAH